MKLKLEASEKDIKDAGLSMWYPKTFETKWTNITPTTPGWYWFDSGEGNAGLFYLRKRNGRDELFTKVYGKPPYSKDAKANHCMSLKRFIGKWAIPDPELFRSPFSHSDGIS